MRRIVCILLAAVLLCAAGCSGQRSSIERPVSYYYCTTAESYEALRKSVSFEVRDGSAYGDDLQGLLNDYLRGPESDGLVNPFPDNCTVRSIQESDLDVRILLSSGFSRLSGIDLTLACVCMSLTVFELSDCQSVSIGVQDALLDGKNEITLHRDDILLEYISG